MLKFSTNKLISCLEAGRDSLQKSGYFVCGGYISPASDAYEKPTLIASKHRLQMCRLALLELENVALDEWEAKSTRYVRSHEVASRIRDAICSWSPKVQLFVICGSDLLSSMRNTQLWPRESAEKLGNCCGFAVKLRGGQQVDVKNELPFINELIWIHGWVGDHSSTLVRYVDIKITAQRENLTLFWHLWQTTSEERIEHHVYDAASGHRVHSSSSALRLTVRTQSVKGIT